MVWWFLICQEQNQTTKVALVGAQDNSHLGESQGGCEIITNETINTSPVGECYVS